MDRITLYDKTFKTYIPHEKILEAVDHVAANINADFKDCGEIPIILCVLNGSLIFTAELLTRLNFKCELASVRMKSYVGLKSSEDVTMAMGITSDIEDRTVIIVEDIVDTGNTIEHLKKVLSDNGAKETRVCTLFFKPEAYCKKCAIDYVAMEIQNQFIVGFGLDYNELGRNYKDIYILDEEA